MKTLVGCALAALLGTATVGRSETCVSDTFDRPYPGAFGVETRLADVPSPRFPGLWQEGRIDGYFYRIWSNDEAVLQPDATAPAWTISVTCDGADMPCRQSITGSPPDGAMRIADDLASCLSDPDFTGRAPDQPARNTSPQPDQAQGDGTVVAGSTDGTPPPQANPAACGLAKLPDGATGLTLQWLLVEAGADPGPLDGVPGRRTYRALVAVLGEPAAQLGEAEAISALDAALCKEGQ